MPCAASSAANGRPTPAAEESHAHLAPLPLLLLAALRGGPLAPLLRMLLQNDSLMDVSGRRELYTEVFGLVAALAGAAWEPPPLPWHGALAC